MKRGPALFRQKDLTRAVKATMAAGLGVQRVEVATDGRIIVITSDGAPSGVLDVDTELAEFRRTHGYS